MTHLCSRIVIERNFVGSQGVLSLMSGDGTGLGRSETWTALESLKASDVGNHVT